MLTTDIGKYAYSAEETLLTDFLLYIYARKTGALIKQLPEERNHLKHVSRIDHNEMFN